MKLSNNLKNIRKENNLSQEQLAEKLGVSRQAVSKWESGQSYPEMDKVLLICKLFNYNIDELMNENVKEVNETKQSKVNINKYIEDFFNFITKTVNMLSAMTFKQKIKCLTEQIMVGLFLAIIFAIIGGIGVSILELMFKGLKIYLVIINVCEAIYITLVLIVGVTILLHIFKIRYLDYYQIVREEDINNNKIQNNQKDMSLENEKEGDDTNINNDIQKDDNILFSKKKEKIVIRDPKHSISKFLIGIIKLVLLCIKFIVAFISIYFIVTFVSLVALLVLSFLFVGAGLVFLGSLFGIISAIIINFIILKLCYNFIVSKKSKKGKLAILFLVSLVLAGVGIGMISIGMTRFNYIENPEENNDIEEVYNVEMKDDLSIGHPYNVEYIETDSNEIKIVVKHSKYYSAEIINHRAMSVDEALENYNTQTGMIIDQILGNSIDIYVLPDNTKTGDMTRKTIKDINNKEIKDYSNYKVYVYTSKENIKKLTRNQNNIK